MSRTIRMFERKARKSHRCNQCPDEIKKGEIYFCHTIAWIGGIKTLKSHGHDCGYEDDEFEEEIVVSQEVIEIPLVLRPLVPLYRENEEEKHDDNRKEKTIGPI